MMQKQGIYMTVVCLLLAAFFYVILVQDGGWADLRQKGMEKAGLQTQSRAIMAENLRLYQQVRRLKHDPEYIGHVARTDLQMVGENDLILKFASPPPTDTEEQGP